MNRTAIIFLLAFVGIGAFVLNKPSPKGSASVPAKPKGIPDPRLALVPVILYHNQKDHRDVLQGPLLIFASWDAKLPNQILGVEDSFTDEQIITGLRKFYREWRPPADDSSCPRPQLILAQQNWGSGAGLYEPLKVLSAEFEIDVYQLYSVGTQFESNPGHPTPNDKRLAELIKVK